MPLPPPPSVMGPRPRADPAMLLHSIAVVVLIEMIYLFILGIPCL